MEKILLSLSRYRHLIINNNERKVNAIEYNTLKNVNQLNSDMEHFFKNVKGDQKFIESIYPFVKNNIEDPDFKVLDIGCGSGILVSKLVKENVSKFVYGCDFSSEKIEKCKKIHNIDSFFVHSIYDLLNQFFDVIICTEVLEHLEHPEQALSNMLKSLNTNGKLIISVPDGRIDTFSGHINFWSPESFKIFIEKTINYTEMGMYVVQFHYINNKNICIIKKSGRVV